MNKYRVFSKLWFLAMLLVTFVAGCASNPDEVPVIPDTVAPTVTFTAPANMAVEVATNRRVAVAFSEAMNLATLTKDSFVVTDSSGVSVPGTVTSVGATAIFKPTSDFANNTNYIATVTTGAKDLAGNALATNYVWTFTTGAIADVIAPTVSVTSPTNTALAVPINRKVGIGFSEAMDPTTVTTNTIKMTGPGLTPVTGTVASANTSAVFTPSKNLAANTVYTLTVTNGVEDLAGNTMLNNYVFTFTTAAAADATRPTVIATINEDGDINVPTNTKVGATFSETMDPLTITSTTFTLKQGVNNVSGIVTYSGTSAVFSPSNTLAAGTKYTATITTGAKDLAGNALLNNYIWSWTTAAAADTTRPTVILVNPADLATNVAINSAVHATFSKSMDPLTISTATFTLKNGVNPVDGTVAYVALSKIATFTPSSNLAANTTYTATITTGAEDLAGNALDGNQASSPDNYVWSFTTVADPVVVPPVASILLTAATYGTFGGTAGMTNTGTLTQIHGDIGTTATDTAKVTGFHDTSGDIYTETPANIGAVNGTIYSCTVSTTGPTSAGVNAASCAKATQARLDAQAAYLALAAKPVSADPGENLGGLTLAPGVYAHSSGKFLITGSDLTLDAKGDANAVFVFQAATSLEVGAAAAPRSIILIGGAQAKNVFWQVGSAATINPGGGGTMAGTIIAQQGVVFSTVGSVNILTLNGRALSLIASVTMVNTVINVPE